MVKYLILALALEKIEDILKKFDPISLKDMDRVALMNRTDTKFAFGRDLLIDILPKILENYSVLEINGKRMARYKTLYYDTEDFDFYIAHQNGKKNRYKIRARKYVDSALTFLEVKFKNNKGRTIKKRITIDDFQSELEKEPKSFIKKTSGKNFDLIPVLWNTFNRITLVHKIKPERLTIDLGLSYEVDDKSLVMENLVIAELKQEKASRDSSFASLVKDLHIRPERISKYCLGIAMLTSGIKSNNFKHKIMKIKKLENDAAA